MGHRWCGEPGASSAPPVLLELCRKSLNEGENYSDLCFPAVPGFGYESRAPGWGFGLKVLGLCFASFQARKAISLLLYSLFPKPTLCLDTSPMN